MSISLPKSRQAGVEFVLSTDAELQEKLLTLSEDFPISVYTQRYLYATSDQIPFHWHDALQVTWVSDGELSYCINGETFLLDSSRLLFVKDHQLHSSRTVRQDTKTLCINFKIEIFSELVQKHYIRPLLERPSFSYMLLPVKPVQIEKLNGFLQWEDRAHGYFSVINFLSGLFEEMLDDYRENNEISDPDDLKLFRKALNCIHTHYAEPLDIRSLSEYISVNKNLLNALFRRYTGLPPIKYLNEYRLYTAKNLVLHTDKPISEIAADVGYNQVSHFIKQFGESYGLPPLKFRSRYGGGRYEKTGTVLSGGTSG